MSILPSNRVVRLALFFYLPMLLGAFFMRPPANLFTENWERLGLGLAAATVVGLAAVGGSRLLVRRTRWGKTLREEFGSLLGPMGSWEILLLSLLSAFGEEFLFRGVLHPRLGLWPTALLFGGFHFPFRPALIPWTVFAFVLGVALGLLTDGAHSIWPAVLLHFFINYFNLHDLVEDASTPADESE